VQDLIFRKKEFAEGRERLRQNEREGINVSVYVLLKEMIFVQFNLNNFMDNFFFHTLIIFLLSLSSLYFFYFLSQKKTKKLFKSCQTFDCTSNITKKKKMNFTYYKKKLSSYNSHFVVINKYYFIINFINLFILMIKLMLQNKLFLIINLK
jgi:hypothetical protein